MQKSTTCVILIGMNIYFLLALCFLPLVLCFAGFKLFSSVKLSSLVLSCVFALIAVLPITFLQFYFSFLVPVSNIPERYGILVLFLKILIFNGLVEELFKTLFIALTPAKKMKFQHFFICTLLFGLCLASFESAVYFLHNLQTASQRGAEIIYSLIFTRIFTSDLIHMLCAGLCGIFVWSVRSRKTDLLALIFAIFIHCAFDFFLSFTGSIRIFATISIIFAILECRVRYQKFASKKAAVSTEENETIIVFQQNEEPGEKRKKLSSSAVVISETDPEDLKKSKKATPKKDSHNDKTIAGISLKNE